MKRCCWDSVRAIATNRISQFIEAYRDEDSIVQNSIRCSCSQVIIIRQASTIDLIGVPVQERIDAEQFTLQHLETE